MPQQRSLIVLAIAVILGLAATYLTSVYLTGVEKQQEVAAPTGTVKVAVARVAMEFGTDVTPDKIRFVDYPMNAVPEGAYATLPALLPMNKKRVVLRPIAINEPVLANKLTGEGGKATIAALLNPNMKAAAIRVSDVASAGGFILPGDSVDILITRSLDVGGASTTVTDVLLQNVRVLALDTNANDATNQPAVGRTATLEVNQVDAQKLALAQSVGSLVLNLRAPGDPVNPLVETVGIQDLRDGLSAGGFRRALAFSRPPPAAAPPGMQPAAVAPGRPAPRRTGPSVEIVRGTAGTTYEVGHARF